jgi:peptidoglycan hydrolase-like protein with peptidoglycan-binding domain
LAAVKRKSESGSEGEPAFARTLRRIQETNASCHALPHSNQHGEEHEKALLTGVVLLSLAVLPASAQVNSPPQPADQHAAQQYNSAGAQQNKLSRDEIMRAQQALDQKGFDVGKADGIMGPRTKQALGKFQQQQKLQQTGQLDQNTLSKLGVSQQESTTGQGGNLQNGKTGTNGKAKQPSGMSR